MRHTPAALATGVALLSLAVPRAAPGMSYVLMSDGDLADRASVIAHVRVDAVEDASDESALDYRVAVEHRVKGTPASVLTVRVPGNPHPKQRFALKLWGVPELEPGTRALLFLNQNGDGTYRMLHLGLGLFTEVRDGSRTLAMRALQGAHEMAAASSRASELERSGTRDMELFERWLERRAAGHGGDADYFVAQSSAMAREQAAAVARARAAERVFWGKVRWFVFDSENPDTRASWFSDSLGQPGVPGDGHPEFRAALAAWTRHRGSEIRYVYSGFTDLTNGLDAYDGVNAILFERPMGDPFDCDAGGTLAMGGPWFDDSFKIEFRGKRYFPILGGDVVVNEGTGCFFERSASPRRAAKELFAHELGHTLGLGHACGDDESGPCTSFDGYDALMRSFIHDDGRGAFLAAHDREAICRLYPRADLTVEECAAGAR